MDMETKVTLENINKILPAGFVIVPVKEPGVVEVPQWTLKQLSKYMCRREEWVRSQFLYQNRRFLEDVNGGPVHFSNGSGSPWRINAKGIKEYIEKHYEDIFEED